MGCFFDLLGVTTRKYAEYKGLLLHSVQSGNAGGGDDGAGQKTQKCLTEEVRVSFAEDPFASNTYYALHVDTLQALATTNRSHDTQKSSSSAKLRYVGLCWNHGGMESTSTCVAAKRGTEKLELCQRLLRTATASGNGREQNMVLLWRANTKSRDDSSLFPRFFQPAVDDHGLFGKSSSAGGDNAGGVEMFKKGEDNETFGQLFSRNSASLASHSLDSILTAEGTFFVCFPIDEDPDGCRTRSDGNAVAGDATGQHTVGAVLGGAGGDGVEDSIPALLEQYVVDAGIAPASFEGSSLQQRAGAGSIAAKELDGDDFADVGIVPPGSTTTDSDPHPLTSTGGRRHVPPTIGRNPNSAITLGRTQRRGLNAVERLLQFLQKLDDACVELAAPAQQEENQESYDTLDQYLFAEFQKVSASGAPDGGGSFDKATTTSDNNSSSSSSSSAEGGAEGARSSAPTSMTFRHLRDLPDVVFKLLSPVLAVCDGEKKRNIQNLFAAVLHRWTAAHFYLGNYCAAEAIAQAHQAVLLCCQTATPVSVGASSRKSGVSSCKLPDGLGGGGNDASDPPLPLPSPIVSIASSGENEDPVLAPQIDDFLTHIMRHNRINATRSRSVVVVHHPALTCEGVASRLSSARGDPAKQVLSLFFREHDFVGQKVAVRITCVPSFDLGTAAHFASAVKGASEDSASDDGTGFMDASTVTLEMEPTDLLLGGLSPSPPSACASPSVPGLVSSTKFAVVCQPVEYQGDGGQSSSATMDTTTTTEGHETGGGTSKKIDEVTLLLVDGSWSLPTVVDRLQGDEYLKSRFNDPVWRGVCCVVPKDFSMDTANLNNCLNNYGDFGFSSNLGHALPYADHIVKLSTSGTPHSSLGPQSLAVLRKPLMSNPANLFTMLDESSSRSSSGTEGGISPGGQATGGGPVGFPQYNAPEKTGAEFLLFPKALRSVDERYSVVEVTQMRPEILALLSAKGNSGNGGGAKGNSGNGGGGPDDSRRRLELPLAGQFVNMSLVPFVREFGRFICKGAGVVRVDGLPDRTLLGFQIAHYRLRTFRVASVLVAESSGSGAYGGGNKEESEFIAALEEIQAEVSTTAGSKNTSKETNGSGHGAAVSGTSPAGPRSAGSGPGRNNSKPPPLPACGAQFVLFTPTVAEKNALFEAMNKQAFEEPLFTVRALRLLR